MKQCSIKGCDRKHYGKTYCKKHYDRFKRNGHPLRSKLTERNSVCEIEGCFNPNKSKGLCSKHYMRLRNHGDPNFTLRPNYGKYLHCTVVGCTKPVHGLKKCRTHYNRMKWKERLVN